MNDIWSQLGSKPKRTVQKRESSTEAVLAGLRKHEPCTTAFLADVLGIEISCVGAAVGNSVRNGRVVSELRKVRGQPRMVKFYSLRSD